jgi:uncharacterized protein YecA (UPF0149 family)
LEKIHSDTTVRKCLELLPQDEDLNVRTCLANALLGQFADESIEPVRELVQRRAYDEKTIDLMEKLVAVSTVVGAAFPEYPIWKREVEKRQAKLERRMKEVEAAMYASPKSAPPPKASSAQEQEDFSERRLSPIFRTEKQVGRNDPCPCGSGKKFKKCCLKRDKG